MRDKISRTVRAYYSEEIRRMRVPAVPAALIGKRPPIRQRVAPFLGSGVAACFLAAAFLAVALSGGARGELARLIAETGVKYEWNTRLEAEVQNIPQAFLDAFRGHE